MKKLNDQYTNITLTDVIKQINKITDIVNALVQTINNLGNHLETGTIRDEIKNLEKKVIVQGDVITKIVELIDDVKRNVVDKI